MKPKFTSLVTWFIWFGDKVFSADLSFSGALTLPTESVFSANLSFSASLGGGEGPVESCPPGTLPAIIPTLMLKEEPTERLEA